jgi:hypothetical protein
MTYHISLVLFVSALFCLFLPTTVEAQVIGAEREVIWDVVSQSVKYPDHTSGREKYQAPSGWFVMDITVKSYGGYGRKGYSISKVEAASDLIEEQKVNEVINNVSRYAKEQGKEDKYNESIEEFRKYYLDTYYRIRSSHSTVFCDWNVMHDGNEIDRKGGSINLKLTLHLVRFATPGELDALEAELRRKIQSGRPILHFAWSSAGPIGPGKHVKIEEPADPHTWGDNFLTVIGGDGIEWAWSSAGPLSGWNNIQWHEPRDPDTWNDNYLNYKYNGDVGYEFRFSSAGPLEGWNCLPISADSHGRKPPHISQAIASTFSQNLKISGGPV